MMVVDASVAAKWLFAEPGREAALELLESPTRLMAPSILHLEVSGAVLRRYRERVITSEQARSMCELWQEILQSGRIDLLAWEGLMQSATALVFKTRHPLYDCIYVTAAKQLDIALITADAAMKKRIGSAFSNITILGKAERAAH